MSKTEAMSDTNSPTRDEGGWFTTRRVLVIPVVVLALLATAVLTFLVTSAMARDDTPGTDSVAAGFARDMSIHHSQAVEMSFVVRQRTDDEQVRTLAYDIINTQTTQRGMMLGWLKQWDLPAARSGAPMGWMSGWMQSHMGSMGTMGSDSDGGPLMPGMATEQQMDELQGAQGRQAEVLFLQLMINHHHGGVMMARAAVDLTEKPDVRRLAQKMDTIQRAEIKLMTRMLRERDAQPLPWPMQRS